jgi:predicted transcriptional regulator
MTEHLPGIEALQRYLVEHEQSISSFARENKLDPSELSKLLRGQRQRISVEQAAQIQDATRGAVSWRLWIPE